MHGAEHLFPMPSAQKPKFLGPFNAAKMAANLGQLWNSHMGLDVTAFGQVIKLRAAEEGEYEKLDWDDERVVDLNPHFPHTHDGLNDHWVYDVSQGERHSFGCGSYSAYGVFRKTLAEVAGEDPEAYWDSPDQMKDKPFYEMINFSDCSGEIGPVACYALYADFIQYREQYHTMFKDDMYGKIRVYDDFTKAFQVGFQNRFVSYH